MGWGSPEYVYRGEALAGRSRLPNNLRRVIFYAILIRRIRLARRSYQAGVDPLRIERCGGGALGRPVRDDGSGVHNLLIRIRTKRHLHVIP